MEWLQELGAIVRVDQVALAGIVTATVVMVLTGRLVSKSVLDDRTAERDSWKQAYLTQAKASTVKDAQISELMEVARTAQHMYRSLPGGDNSVESHTQPARDG